MNTPPCQAHSWNKTKTIGHTTTCDTPIILCNSNISNSFSYPKTWGKGPKRLKTQKMIIFHNFEHSSLPTLMIKKTTTIGHVTLTCPKSLGKRTQMAKNPEKMIFHNHKHSSLPTSLIKGNKNNWARNYIWHLFYFVQFSHKPLLNLRPNG